MKYRITIEKYHELPQVSAGGYRNEWEEIYKQQIDNLDIPAVVVFLNTGSYAMADSTAKPKNLGDHP